MRNNGWSKPFASRVFVVIFVIFISLFQAAASAHESDSGNLKFSLLTRQKLQWLENDDFSGTDQQQYLQRWIGGIRWSLSDHIELHAEVNASTQIGQMGSYSPREHNVLDFQQAYWQIRDDGLGELRLGRQVWSIELQRQLGAREGTNVRRSFDGVRWELPSGSVIADPDVLVEATSLYHGWLVEPQLGMFNDKATGDLSVSVVAQRYRFYRHLVLYWHYIRARDTRDQNDGLSTDELRHVFTIGHRSDESLPLWHHFEIATQRGSHREDRIQSFWGYARLTANMFGVSPFIGFNFASGDRRPKDGVDQRFSPLYAKAPFYSEAGVIASTNVRSLQVGIAWNSDDHFSIDGDVQHLKKIQVNDLLYGPGGSSLQHSMSGVDELAWAANVRMQSQVTPVSTLELTLSKLWHQTVGNGVIKQEHQHLSFAEFIWHYRFF